jgi:carbon-monoxide dehydrogenase medium subunit
MFARPGLPQFDYVRASTPDEVIGLLAKHGKKAKLLMGGTDLLPGLRDGLLRPGVVIDVKALAGMRDIRFAEEGDLTIGAAVTMNALARHLQIAASFPPLAEAANTVASFQVRNRATVGGNLCNASPCADTSPVMLVLKAEFILRGRRGERSLAADQFFLGPGLTALQPDEFMTAIRIPALPAGSEARYLKLGRCKTGDLSLVGVAVLGYPVESRPGYQFRIALGSVAPVPLRVTGAEQILLHDAPGEESFEAAAREAMASASPITDVRGTAGYQRAMVRTLTLRALRDVWARLEKRG